MDPIAPTTPITFQWPYPAKSVFLGGSFSNWNLTPMKKTSDRFEVKLSLSQGHYIYKFMVDGEWTHDPLKPMVDDGHAGFNNTININLTPLFKNIPGFTQTEPQLTTQKGKDTTEIAQKEYKPEKMSNNKWRTVVLKIGGSFLLKEAGAPDVSEVRDMADTVKELVKNNWRVIVVVGGGITARNYINAGTQLGASKGVLDHLGILVSRLNARVFIEALNSDDIVISEPAESLQQVRSSIQTKPVVVLGGLQPGQSTTAVAALCAEYCSADKVIYGTDVEAVYTADPRKDKNAKRLDKITYEHLRSLIITSDNILPGQYRIMDGVALTILERSKIPAQILLGSKDHMLSAILKEEAIGTIIG